MGYTEFGIRKMLENPSRHLVALSDVCGAMVDKIGEKAMREMLGHITGKKGCDVHCTWVIEDDRTIFKAMVKIDALNEYLGDILVDVNPNLTIKRIRYSKIDEELLDYLGDIDD